MKKKQAILIIIILTLIIWGGLFLVSDNTRIYKQTIDKTYEFLDKTLTKYQNIPGLFNKNNNFSLEVSNQKETINLNFQTNPQEEQLYLDLGLANKNYTYLYSHNSSYLKKDNIYQAFDINIPECEECPEESLNTIIANSINTNNASYDSVKTLLKDLKKVLKASLSKNYITKKTITSDNTKQTEYTYLLNNNSLSHIISKINNNKSLKDNLFNTYGAFLSNYDITSSNFNDIFKDSDISGTFKITSVKNKVQKIEINFQNGFSLTVNLLNTPVIYYKSNTLNFKSTIGDTTFNLGLYMTNTRYLELNKTLINNKIISIDYNLYNGLNKTSGNLKINGHVITLTNDKMSLNLKYSLDNNINIPDDLSSKTISSEELETYIDDIETSIEDSDILKSIISYLQDLDIL